MADQNIGRLHVEITGDNSDLVKKLDDSSQELNKASGKVADFSKNIGVLRQEYKRLSKESFVGKSAEEIKQVEMRLASLRDEIGDYDARIKSLSQDPFQKAAKGVQQLSTMMAGAAGAASLFGGSEEKLNALMKKTIALIAIAEAAQTAADFTKQNAIGIFIKEKYAEIAARIREGLVIKTNTAATVAETGAKTGLSIVQKTLIVLQNAWNKALLASPIMWIIAGLAAVTVGVLAVVKAYRSHNAELEAANKVLERNNAIYDSINATNELRIEILKAQGKSAKEINNAELNQVQERLLFLRGEIDLIEKQQKSYKDLKRIKDTYGSFDNARKQLEVYNKEFEEFSAKYKDLLKEGTAATVKESTERTAQAKKEAEDIYKIQTDIYNKLRYQKWDIHKAAMADANKRFEEEKAQRYWQVKAINDINALRPEEAEVDDLFEAKAIELGNKIRKYNEEISKAFNETITSGINDLTGGIAEAVGAMAGGAGIDTLFKGIGESIANFTSSLGKSLIAAGIGAMAFKKLLINPAAAIVAGAGLIAVSGFIRQKLSAGPGGGGSTAASSSGSSSTSSGDTGYRTIFADRQEIKLVGELRPEGNVLVASLYNENKRATN